MPLKIIWENRFTSEVWKEATGNDYLERNSKLQRPVLNLGAEQIVRSFEDWNKFITYCPETFGSTNKDVNKKSAIAKIAKSAVEVSKSEKIKADLYFFVGFGRAFFKKHMNWLHANNSISGTYIHSSHEMPLRAAMMKWEMKDLITSDSWLDHDDFKDAKSMLGGLEDDVFVNVKLTKAGRQTTLKQWKDFIIVFQRTLHNHTSAWYGKELLPFAIASSNKEVRKVFTCWLLDKECLLEGADASAVDDDTHCCTIDLKR